MASTVQATCPQCRSTLRIPGEWADRAMKCKKCGAAFKGRGKPAPSEPAALPTYPQPAYPQPQASPYPAVPQEYPYAPPQANGYPYPPPGYGYAPPGYPPGYGPPQAYPAVGFPTNAYEDLGDGELPTPGGRRYRRTHGGNKLVGAAIAIVVIAGLLGGGMFLSKYLDKQQAGTRGGNGTTAGGDPKGAAQGADAGKGGPGAANPLAKVGDPFPRRMLFLHVSNYIYFNGLSAGSSGGQDMATKSAAKMAFELRVPTEKDNNQLFVLSDTTDKKDFRPPTKPVLSDGIDKFCATSREQDRILIYFGGHAVLVDGKPYLVPVEGEPDNPDTMIPLADVYAKIAASKAQQKIVLLDVCRLDPDRGEEKPGSEKMSEDLHKALLAAPAGVQVAVTCGPGQNAQEFTDSGSEFLTAFRVVAERTRRAGKAVAAKPEDAIPMTAWLDGLKNFLADPRGKVSPQTLKYAGADGGAVAYAKDAPPAAKVDWLPAAAGVGAAEVEKMLAQVNLPGIRKDLSVPTDLPRVYPFAADVMKAYADDGVTEEMIEKDPEKYAVRKAALDGLKVINTAWRKAAGDSGKIGFKEEFEGDVDDKVRKDILKTQEPVAKLNLELVEAINAIDEAGKKLDDEKNKRWRAVFHYTHAQLLLRWALMNEYDAVLGKIVTNSLPKDEGKPTAGYRLVSTGKVTRKDTKEKVEAAKELLDKLAEDHKGTPYEVLAKLHKYINVGLEWRAIPKEEMKKDDDAK